MRHGAALGTGKLFIKRLRYRVRGDGLDDGQMNPFIALSIAPGETSRAADTTSAPGHSPTLSRAAASVLHNSPVERGALSLLFSMTLASGLFRVRLEHLNLHYVNLALLLVHVSAQLNVMPYMGL